ncbi:AvrD family protein [Amycolatopsis thailandensis]|uniref:AvrD family protein n=1 Tax=Amycolatopsis thailandensis TaxID=589330 RepID=UPI00142E74F6|nr:AvrD family protein [Amycolatopsis thailandensis]
MHDAFSSAIRRAPRRFASIDDQLGPRADRYFGDGFKRVSHRITDAVLDPRDSSIAAHARLQYPIDWSSKATGPDRTPHVSSLDVAALAVQLADLYFTATFGLTDEQRRDLTIRRLTVKAGRSPQEQLADVPMAAQRVVTKNDSDAAVTRFTGHVGGLATLCEVVHPRDLHAQVSGPRELLAGESLGDPARRYFGSGFQTRDHELRDVLVAENHTVVSATARITGDQIHPRGIAGRYQPAITLIDGMIVLAQLAQSLLYDLDDIDRGDSNTLWLRNIDVVGPPPHQRLGMPFRTSASVTRTGLVAFAGGTWRTSSWRALFSGLQFQFRLAHELPTGREAK